MNKDIVVFGEDKKGNIYLGTVEDFLNMSDKSWAEMRQSILINFGAIWCRDANYQYSKLKFTSIIDEMRTNE